MDFFCQCLQTRMWCSTQFEMHQAFHNVQMVRLLSISYAGFIWSPIMTGLILHKATTWILSPVWEICSTRWPPVHCALWAWVVILYTFSQIWLASLSCCPQIVVFMWTVSYSCHYVQHSTEGGGGRVDVQVRLSVLVHLDHHTLFHIQCIHAPKFSYRKRRYKRPGRLLGTLLGSGGGWAFIKTIYLMYQYVNVLLTQPSSVGASHLVLISRVFPGQTHI